MQNNNNIGNSWQQIIHDAGSRFNTGAFDDPIAEISRLKQDGPLIDYLENFDTLLARVLITEDLALSFFLFVLTPKLEKSVRVHRPKTIQEAIRIARLQEEVLQGMAKKFSLAKSISFES